MARPPKKSPTIPQEEPVSTTAQASTLSPAADNGVPYGQQAPGAPGTERVARRGKQLGARIPQDLYERLVACAQDTRIPQGRLIERALDAELKSHGF